MKMRCLVVLFLGACASTEKGRPTPVEAATAFLEGVQEILREDPELINRVYTERFAVYPYWGIEIDEIRSQLERVVSLVNRFSIEEVQLEPHAADDLERARRIFLHAWFLAIQPGQEWEAALSPFRLHESKGLVRVQFGFEHWDVISAVMTEEDGRWLFTVLPGEDEVEGVLDFEYRDGTWWYVPPD